MVRDPSLQRAYRHVERRGGCLYPKAADRADYAAKSGLVARAQLGT